MLRRVRGCGLALVAALGLSNCKEEAPPAPPPAPPAAPAPAPPPPPLPVVDAGPPDAGPEDAGPVDAGPPDAGALDAGPVDAGPVDAGTPAAPAPATEPLAADPNTALQKPIRACFRQSEKYHWGPQEVVLKGTIAAKNGVGVLTDGAVVQASLHDAQSTACFLAMEASVQFVLNPKDVGQTQTFTFQHVPRVK